MSNGMDYIPEFHDWKEYVHDATVDLATTNGHDLVKYPIKFLNDALRGVFKSELVVIGADTGLGKSELVGAMAYTNAKKKKNVYVFSLEGDKYEFVQREKYRKILEIVEERNLGLNLNYRDYLANLYMDELLDITVEVDKKLALAYDTLHIYNRNRPLDIKLLSAQLQSIHYDADLVIIDHLQYFDFFSNNEHRELTEIMKRIQELKTLYRIPIVLVSHLRKKGADRFFPDNNDFHGTSNIAKQADTTIILSPIRFLNTQNEDNEADNFSREVKSGVYPTGVRITKCRTGMSQRIIGVVDYELSKRRYKDNYYLAVCGNSGIFPMDKEMYPYWASREEEEEYPF